MQIPEVLRPHFIPAEAEHDEMGAETEVLRAPRFAGRYDYNNGMVVVYDEGGNPFVCLSDELRRHGVNASAIGAILQDAGFVCGAYVPHSNDGGAWAARKWPEAFALLRQTSK